MFTKKTNVLLVVFLGLNFSQPVLGMSYIRSWLGGESDAERSARQKREHLRRKREKFSRVQENFRKGFMPSQEGFQRGYCVEGTNIKQFFFDLQEAYFHIRDNNYNYSENFLEYVLTFLRAWNRKSPQDYKRRYIREMETALRQKRQNKNKKGKNR